MQELQPSRKYDVSVLIYSTENIPKGDLELHTYVPYPASGFYQVIQFDKSNIQTFTFILKKNKNKDKNKATKFVSSAHIAAYILKL